MAVIIACEQRTPEWHRARLGRPSASAFESLITPKGKATEGVKRQTYLHRLLAEFILDAPLEDVQTDWMQRGQDQEPMARSRYEFDKGEKVQEVGFVTLDDGTAGASPDGFVNGNIIVEIKAPKAHTHMGYLLARGIEEEYKPQVQGLLYICEREFVDTVSYYPGLPTAIHRTGRDDAYIAKLSAALRQFTDELAAARVDLEQRYGPFKREIEAAEAQKRRDSFMTDADAEQIIRDAFPAGA